MIIMKKLIFSGNQKIFAANNILQLIQFFKGETLINKPTINYVSTKQN